MKSEGNKKPAKKSEMYSAFAAILTGGSSVEKVSYAPHLFLKPASPRRELADSTLQPWTRAGDGRIVLPASLRSILPPALRDQLSPLTPQACVPLLQERVEAFQVSLNEAVVRGNTATARSLDRQIWELRELEAFLQRGVDRGWAYSDRGVWRTGWFVWEDGGTARYSGEELNEGAEDDEDNEE